MSQILAPGWAFVTRLTGQLNRGYPEGTSALPGKWGRQEFIMGLEKRESRRGELRGVGTIRPSRTLSFTLNKMRTQ